MSKPVKSSPIAAFARNNDPLTIALRRKDTLGLDDLVRLNQTRSLISDVSTSDGSASTVVFSSREASSDTKPTSAGTCYPLYDSEGKRKDAAAYSSSLSATHGSGSEAELEIETSQRIDLLGTGSWMSDNSTSKHIFKDSTRSRQHGHKKPGLRNKKPPVVVHQHPLSSTPGRVSESGGTVTPLSCGKGYSDVSIIQILPSND
jgi:hypothetical protein